MLVPGLTNLVRWQNHWHVVRQGWTFFQNDFAGRIAARVMQTGPALRESVVLSVAGIWYILVYGTTAILLLSAADWRLAVPIVVLVRRCIGWVLSRFLPQMRERSRAMSEMRSVLTGKIVDSYTNILTVKLFARARDEDAFVRDAVDEHTETWRAQQRIGTWWGLCLQAMNALLLVGTGALAIGLWANGHIEVGTVATAIPMAWQINTHVRRAGAADREHLRRCRAGAGRHALDRGGAADARSAGRGRDAARHAGRSASRMSVSTTAAARGAAASCAGWISTSRRASGSGWSAAPGPANRRWCICCSGSTGRRAGAS